MDSFLFHLPSLSLFLPGTVTLAPVITLYTCSSALVLVNLTCSCSLPPSQAPPPQSELFS